MKHLHKSQCLIQISVIWLSDLQFSSAGNYFFIVENIRFAFP